MQTLFSLPQIKHLCSVTAKLKPKKKTVFFALFENKNTKCYPQFCAPICGPSPGTLIQFKIQVKGHQNLFLIFTMCLHSWWFSSLKLTLCFSGCLHILITRIVINLFYYYRSNKVQPKNALFVIIQNSKNPLLTEVLESTH